MGSAPIYLTAASGAYLSASVTWNSSGIASGGSITVYIDVSSNGGWRLKKGSTTYFDRQGSLSSSFTGNVGSTYQFQLWDTVEQNWQLQNFTVTQDSSGGGDSGGGDSGGGDSGGGESTNYYYLSYYEEDGSTLFSRSSEAEGSTISIRSSGPSKSSTSSKSNFTITGNANGGTFPSGAITSITANKTVTTSYKLNRWNTNNSGTGTSYGLGATINMPSYNLNLYPQYSGSDSASCSNNNLSRLTTPNPPSDSTTATYTATFSPNGGSVNTVSQSVTATITKTFDGWMTSSSGTSTVTTLTYQGTVYAKWGDNYTNNTIVLPLPSRSGYNFNGWSTSESGTNLKDAGTVVAITSNTTFYAFWTEKEKPKGGVFIYDGTMWQLVSS